MDQKFLEEEAYKGNLRREEANWNMRYQRMLASDRAAVDLGLLALRTIIAMHAGAIVLTITIRHKNDAASVPPQPMLASVWPFLCGLVLALLCALVAYVYQSIVTAKFQRSLAEVSEGKDHLKPAPWLGRLFLISGYTMLGLGIVSLAMFVLGCVLATMRG